jgi:2-methylcitrate dehydratase PrpD
MGLDQQQILWALGNAATQACGLVENLGTMSKSLSVGNAAKNGLLSAICAAENFDGPNDPLEGVRGFLQVFGDQVHAEHLNDKLGSRWEVLNNTYKPFPCGVVLNPVIEACLDIYEQEQSNPEFLSSIQEIRIMGNPLLKQRTDRPSIENGRQSQVSGQHAVSVALHFGQAGLKEFSDEIVKNDKIHAFYSKVSFLDDSAIAVDGVKIQLICNDRVIEKQIDHAKGSVSRPLTDRDLENKLRNQIIYHQLKLDAEKIIKLIWSIDHLQDVSVLLSALEFNQS